MIRPTTLLASLLLLLPTLAPAEPIPLNSVAATVNGEPITEQEVNFAMAAQLGQLLRLGSVSAIESAREELRAETLDELVDNRLIMQEFARRDLPLPASVVDEEIERIVREQFDGDRRKFVEDLDESNLTQAGFRRLIREQIIVREMRRAVLGLPSPPGPDDIERAYRDHADQFRGEDFVRYRSLFIPRASGRPGVTEEDQRALAEEIRRQIENGGDFAELARQHSALPNAANGGANPVRGRNDLLEWSRGPIFNTDVGQVSELVELPTGFMLYYVENIQRGDLPPMAEIRDQLETLAREDSQRGEFEEWMERLRAQAVIDRN